MYLSSLTYVSAHVRERVRVWLMIFVSTSEVHRSDRAHFERNPLIYQNSNIYQTAINNYPKYNHQPLLNVVLKSVESIFAETNDPEFDSVFLNSTQKGQVSIDLNCMTF